MSYRSYRGLREQRGGDLYGACDVLASDGEQRIKEMRGTVWDFRDFTEELSRFIEQAENAGDERMVRHLEGLQSRLVKDLEELEGLLERLRGEIGRLRREMR